MKPDIYVWKARRCPVLLAVLPPALAVLASFPDTDWKMLLPAVTFCGLFLLLAQVGRDRGKVLEDGLFAGWGGKPTTALLRHRNSPYDEATLARLHSWLASVTGVAAPSKRKETCSPADADEVYEAYTRHLRDATRDKQQYPLVFEENVNYGFRRNALGLRPLAIGLAVIGVLGGAFNIYRHLGDPVVGLAVAATVVNVLLLCFWAFWVRRAWVRIPAQAYAERLMEAALRMARPSEEKQPQREPNPQKS
jgi:hypothetical protein